MVAELNGASSAPQEIMQRSRNESDARTRPKVSRAKGVSWCGFGSFNVLICQSALWLRKSYVAGEMKYRVIHRHVGFDLIDYDPLLVRRPLAPELD
jgi:hypothetical protein